MPLKPCAEHDWMEWGSKRLCVLCGKTAARQDLPDWEYRQNGSIVKKATKKTAPSQGGGTLTRGRKTR